MRAYFFRWLDRLFPGDSGSAGLHNQSTRDEWVQQKLAQLPAGSRLLDAGAGELRYRPACTHLDYVSQDFAQYDGRGDGAGLQTGSWDQARIEVVSDIAHIPLPDASFDAILCTEVFEHIPHPVEALRELTRLAKNGGTLILTAPFCSLTHFSPYFYQTGYSRYFYEYWLAHLGWEIQELAWNGNYFEYLAQELRRLPDVGQQYAGQGFSWLEYKASEVLLKALQRFSTADRGSQELLSFGLHVLARKKV